VTRTQALGESNPAGGDAISNCSCQIVNSAHAVGRPWLGEFALVTLSYSERTACLHEMGLVKPAR
jgi:hypothetical protein